MPLIRPTPPPSGRRLLRTQADLDLLPQPADGTRLVAPGLDPDRVLLLGNGPVIGFGVLTHDLALPGQLARRLATSTGRGAVVDVVARRGLRTSAAGALLRGVRASAYDAVVLAVGATDAAARLSPARYREDLTRLLDEVRAAVSPGTAVALLPVRPLQPSPTGLTADLHVNRRAARFDAIAAALCTARGDAVVAGAGSELAARSPGDYLALADRIVPVLVEGLDAQCAAHAVPTARDQRRMPDPEVLRQASVAATGLVGTGGSPALDALLQQAVQQFGVGSAAVTLVDGDRVVFKATIGIDADSAPRATAPCNRTIRQDGPLVAGDLAGQPIADTGFRFYAGHPLESPSGFRVGTLCILDPAPREDADVDGVALAALARRVEAELWREIADAAPPAVRRRA